MSQEEQQSQAGTSENESVMSPLPRHFSREPWWIVPLAGIVTALLPLIKYGEFQRKLPGVGLVEAMITAGVLGLLASSILVGRSHVRSVLWSNLVLWLGILVVAAGISVFLALLSS